jgi:AraC-like DNA-binding protein
VTATGQLQLHEHKLAPGQEWIDNSETWRVVLLRTGAAYWLDTARPRALTAGEVLVLAPRVGATIRASQLGDASLAWFPFDLTQVYGIFTMAERQWFECAAERGIDPTQFLPSTHPIAQAMRSLLDRTPAEPELIQRGEALVLALRVLAQNMPAQQPAPGRTAAAQDRFYQIIAHMPDSELIQRTCEELAGLCGCTSRHFNRLFRARFGQSPRVRQTELRLLKARALLESSGQPVAHIAVECGYRSLSLFNSLFKRRFGFSPSEWRQKAALAGAQPKLNPGNETHRSSPD